MCQLSAKRHRKYVGFLHAASISGDRRTYDKTKNESLRESLSGLHII